MDHTDIRLFIARDRMETLQREARIEAERRRRVRATTPIVTFDRFRERLQAVRLARIAFLRPARG